MQNCTVVGCSSSSSSSSSSSRFLGHAHVAPIDFEPSCGLLPRLFFSAEDFFWSPKMSSVTCRPTSFPCRPSIWCLHAEMSHDFTPTALKCQYIAFPLNQISPQMHKKLLPASLRSATMRMAFFSGFTSSFSCQNAVKRTHRASFLSLHPSPKAFHTKLPPWPPLLHSRSPKSHTHSRRLRRALRRSRSAPGSPYDPIRAV